MPGSCAAFGCTSLEFCRIPSATRYPERRMKWVTAMRREKWLAKKINNAQICSSHFATDEPSQFSKG